MTDVCMFVMMLYLIIRNVAELCVTCQHGMHHYRLPLISSQFRVHVVLQV